MYIHVRCFVVSLLSLVFYMHYFYIKTYKYENSNFNAKVFCFPIVEFNYSTVWT